ncbi:hypothetical protein E4P54_16485 [Salmonella enterica subsp. enterica serovar Panama]|uniref:hypothetical protein n=1 Tax=Enterobacteriaceae TaxID=543 RepID=UPI0014753529|nr:hypothetical protein [Salmonella enterica]EGO0259852.1 hypothetical protein [Salmonella enterica subsp. enterica serovar Panama]EGP7450134.1 hypothetical protein [Salmonella enterica subsp. enterica serovar Panama]NMF70699.1 hypothetical protein [Salmonella enterica subsp. enterica serovar Panama]NMF75423.1 hypothetical protein [Salmonella enterica subsp. enterica serovar Panama]NMF80148.1 hypothetical protein [Salmonella enterica subsp. enterica serovar Panama]
MADRTDGMKGRELIKQLSGMPYGVNPLNVPHQLKRTVCLAKGIADTWDSFPSENNLAIALESAAAISRLAISLLQEREVLYRQLASLGVEPEKIQEVIKTIPMDELMKNLNAHKKKS